MINRFNTSRIKSDAYIAVDALQSIMFSDDEIHEDYLKEKVDTVQRCLDFMKHFCEEDSHDK